MSFGIGDGSIQLQQQDLEMTRLDGVHLTRRVGRKQILLDDVSLSILSGEFVAILGVSGAGKTTLLDALSGFRPANRGHVFVNGEDLYLNFNDYRTQLGYVPQDDIIHQELTVYQAFDFSARLRLPPNLPKKERHRQIQSVLADLELTHRQHGLVKNLSGGQRKRVSIGVELLTKPRLFFLDEATSGLDPGTEHQMMLLLRRLADGGRTVLLNTHTTKNVMLCDMVVFLTKGGKVAFYGPPQEALTYFGVQDFDDIYLKVEEEESSHEWQQKYLQSTAYQHYVNDRQADLTEQQKAPSPKRLRGFQALQSSSAWRQLRLLSQRNLTILVQDRAGLVLMLLVAPILGLLDLIMVRRNVFDVTQGDSGQALTLMFLSGLIAVLVGSLATMREIVKEAEIYRRERMLGLKVVPYILSKIWLCVVIAIYQSAIFWMTKIYLVDLPHNDFNTQLAMYFTLFMSTLAGLIMGLLISALSTTQNIAPLLTVLFLVPQITLAGAIFPLNALGPPGQWISRITVTRWSYEAMVSLSGLGQDVAQDACWKLPDSARQGWTEADKKNCRCLGPHIFERCYFPGLKKEYDPVVDQPEPVKPKDLGDPPNAPENLLSSEASGFRDDLNNYKNQVKTYRKAMDRWQDQLSRWKEKRGTAIASGEALITRVRRTQGGSFAVNVRQHWGILAALQAGMLGLLMIVQKRKDVL
jgi:ABC transport system ATP-binding/permease protein